MATYYSGCSGDMTFGGTALALSKWGFTDKSPTTKVKTKQSGGRSVSVSCGREGEITGEGFFDADIHEGDPPVLYAGKSGTFELESEDAGSSVSGSCVLTEVKFESATDDVMKFSFTAETVGDYYLFGEATS